MRILPNSSFKTKVLKVLLNVHILIYKKVDLFALFTTLYLESF